MFIQKTDRNYQLNKIIIDKSNQIENAKKNTFKKTKKISIFRTFSIKDDDSSKTNTFANEYNKLKRSSRLEVVKRGYICQ